MPLESDTQLHALLQRVRIFAVVGLSASPDKPSHEVAAYLQRAGYRIVPVHPQYRAVLGEICHPDLQAAALFLSPHLSIDVALCFRRPEHMPAVAQAAVAAGARCLWMQPGAASEAAAAIAGQAGLDVVVDRCVKVEHRRLGAVPK